MEKTFGVTVLEGYGCTESSAVVSASTVTENRPGSVGTPLPHHEVAILDQAGEPLASGEEGEICVRGSGVMLGYWNDPEQTAATIVDGWLHTGDVGRFDEDGYLYVVDRVKDLIIRGGFNVFPRDVEDVLMEHAKARLARYKYPREVLIVDGVPLTSVGKTDRKAVRAMVR